MPDTKTTASTSDRFRVDRTVMEARCAELGAHTADERAALMGVNRTTIARWVTGSNTPSTEVIESVCERLRVARHVLFPGLTATPVQTIAEAAAKVAANWPALDAAQKDDLSRILAPVVAAGQPRRTARRAA